MKKLIALTAAAVALGFATPSFAATTTKSAASMESCQALMKQFDTSLTSHAKAPRLSQAKSMRAAGERNCTAKKYALGVRELRTALTDLKATTPVHHVVKKKTTTMTKKPAATTAAPAAAPVTPAPASNN